MWHVLCRKICGGLVSGMSVRCCCSETICEAGSDSRKEERETRLVALRVVCVV